jgi:hypothetical protein
VTNEYVKHQGWRIRLEDGSLDIGAYEYDPDSDDDGIPDSWELQYFGSLTNMDGTSDSDGDGLLDWQEHRAGTEPTNSASSFRLTGLEGGGSVLLTWDSVSDRVYSVGLATDLVQAAGFVVLTNGLVATPAENTFTDTVHTALPRAFYRIGVAGPE